MPSRLLGRDAELRDVTELLAARRPVLIVGEPGVGKTSLMRAASERAGGRVLEGGGLSMLATRPLLAIERALGRRPPEGDDVAVAAELRAGVGDGVLIADDLQW